MNSRYEYCSIYKGVAFLNDATGTEWRGIPRQALFPTLCVATILPTNTILAKWYPILDQPGYIPKPLVSAVTPDRLYAYLRTTGKQVLKIMPSVKYSLEGIVIKITSVVPRGNLLYVIEGIAHLIGDIAIKPSGGLNPISLSADHKTIELRGIQARNDFITSLKINNYVPDGSPSLSISSKLNDQVLMTTTSIKLTQEGNSQQITATFIPEYHEIETKFGLALEIQMGCEFTGKVTVYTKPPGTLDKLEHAIHSLVNMGEHLTQAVASNANPSVVTQGFWLMAGTVILCVLAAA